MAATMGQNKGKRGEREVKDMFVELMQIAEQATGKVGVSERVKRNTTQSDRGGDDIVGIPLLSIEVKRQETLQLNQWWQQAVAQGNKQKLQPVLIYRQNRKAWRVQTWAVLCQPHRSSHAWVRCDIELVAFLDWYRAMYAEWLTAQSE